MPPSADRPATLAVAATFEEVRRLAAHLQDVGAAAGIDPMILMDCELALVEAANNVVEHGLVDGAGGEDAITLVVSIGDGFLRMELADRGTPVPQGHFEDEVIPAPLDALSGRGTGIIRACIDEIAYASEGGENRLVMLKRLG